MELARIAAPRGSILPLPGDALPFNLRAADAGDEKAAYRVGEALLKGDGVAADRARAGQYFKKADWVEGARYNYALILADTDIAKAADEMAVECDMPAALAWFKQKAEAGVAAVQVEYGSLLSYGGCKLSADKAAAFGWYKKAADQNYLPGIVALGQAYLNGYNGTFDKERGVATLRRAADRGFADAQAALGSEYLQQANQAGLSKDYAREAELRATGRGWMQKAIAQGHLGAMQALADRALIEGAILIGTLGGDYGGPKPDTLAKAQQTNGEALKYYRMAAAKGDTGSWLQIGSILDTAFNRQPVSGISDFAGARQAYLSYLRAGGTESRAYAALGELYAQGMGGPVDVGLGYFYHARETVANGKQPAQYSRAAQMEKVMSPAEKARGQALLRQCAAENWRPCAY